MKYFFMVIDYLIPIMLIISKPYWNKIANGDINEYWGMRTSLSMANKENWKKANLLCGKYCLWLGIALCGFTAFMRWIEIVPMEWNSLILSTIDIISILVMVVVVNGRLKKDEF